tara:strand:- start:569 stop:3634 length:3066 start_codon:yes stop_codon:yes gene_type:complete
MYKRSIIYLGLLILLSSFVLADFEMKGDERLLRSDSPATEFSNIGLSVGTFESDEGNALAYSIVRFSFDNAYFDSTEIEKAELVIQVNSGSTNPLEVQVNRITQDWDSATFNNIPAYASPTGTIYLEETANYFVDITDLVQDWMTSGNNNGIIIKEKNENINRISNKDIEVSLRITFKGCSGCPDFNGDNSVGIVDLIKIATKLFSGDLRYDLNTDDKVRLGDIFCVSRSFGRSTNCDDSDSTTTTTLIPEPDAWQITGFNPIIGEFELPDVQITDTFNDIQDDIKKYLGLIESPSFNVEGGAIWPTESWNFIARYQDEEGPKKRLDFTYTEIRIPEHLRGNDQVGNINLDQLRLLGALVYEYTYDYFEYPVTIRGLDSEEHIIRTKAKTTEKRSKKILDADLLDQPFNQLFETTTNTEDSREPRTKATFTHVYSRVPDQLTHSFSRLPGLAVVMGEESKQVNEIEPTEFLDNLPVPSPQLMFESPPTTIILEPHIDVDPPADGRINSQSSTYEIIRTGLINGEYAEGRWQFDEYGGITSFEGIDTETATSRSIDPTDAEKIWISVKDYDGNVHRVKMSRNNNNELGYGVTEFRYNPETENREPVERWIPFGEPHPLVDPVFGPQFVDNPVEPGPILGASYDWGDRETSFDWNSQDQVYEVTEQTTSGTTVPVDDVNSRLSELESSQANTETWAALEATVPEQDPSDEDDQDVTDSQDDIAQIKASQGRLPKDEGGNDNGGSEGPSGGTPDPEREASDFITNYPEENIPGVSFVQKYPVEGAVFTLVHVLQRHARDLGYNPSQILQHNSPEDLEWVNQHQKNIYDALVDLRDQGFADHVRMEGMSYISNPTPGSPITPANFQQELVDRYNRFHIIDYPFYGGGANKLAVEEGIEGRPAEHEISIKNLGVIIQLQGINPDNLHPDVRRDIYLNSWDTREDRNLAYIIMESQGLGETSSTVVFGGGHMFGGELCCGEDYPTQRWDNRNQLDNIYRWNYHNPHHKVQLIEITPEGMEDPPEDDE